MVESPHAPVRVALITPYFWPIVGGITSAVDSLARGLQRRAISVRIFTQHGARAADVEVGPADSFAFARWARRQLRTWGPNIVHAHAHWDVLVPGLTLFGSIAPRTVFSVHTDFGPRQNLFREKGLRWLFGRADVITANTAPSLRKFQVRFPRIRQAEVLPPVVRHSTVEESEIKAAMRSANLENRSPRLCSISQMVWPEKVRGLEFLIRAMPDIIRAYSRAALVIVGDGELRPKLEELVVNLGLESVVRFVGAQRNPTPYVLASDLVIHLSFQETLGLSALEAMVAGRPVVVNRTVAENLPAEFTDKALLIAPDEPHDFATFVVHVIADADKRQNAANRGQELVRNYFGETQVINRTLRVYGLS